MGYASLAELTADRRRAVTGAHEIIGSGLRDFLVDLYPDNAHFIYELLQNAEDARAATVDFDLKQGALAFTHDGTKEFTLDDIEAITTIGHSTKRTDETTIGKFGVGFKAVFSYTNRPQVRSGQYAFAIEDLFVPEPLEAVPTGGKTIITFPFDRKEKPQELAYEEAARGLRALSETTVLFLRNIQTIRYRLADGSTGSVTRTDMDYPFVRIRHEADGEGRESHWLRLVGDFTLSELIPRGQAVAAAFRLDGAPGEHAATEKPRRVSVEPLPRGDTCVYFPAGKESSGLRFHIHAPFAPTPARDSIKDTPDNGELADAVGRLVASSLLQLRDDGWLTDGLLEALPNGDDVLAPPYTAIRGRIHEAFRAKPLTPVVSGRYAPASTLVSSPSAFRTALDTADLKFLTKLLNAGYPESPRWVPERAGRAGRFLAGLGVTPFGWSELDDVFGAVSQGDESLATAWRSWLLVKHPGQVKAFYELIGQGLEEDKFEKSWHLFRFAGPLIRVRMGNTAEVVPPARVYLPSSPEDITEGRVSAELAYFDSDTGTKSKRRLAAFYQAVDVKRWDARTEVQERLARYQAGTYPTVEQNVADTRSFIAYLNSNPQDVGLFRGLHFLLGKKAGESRQWWARADQLYLDTPYRETGLAKLYGDMYGLSDAYSGEVDGIEEFVTAIGVTTSLSIVPAYVQVNKELNRSWYSSGSRNTYQGVKKDWDLPNLPTILNSVDPALLRTLWLLMVETPEHYRCATFQVNGSTTPYLMRSQLTQRLEAAAWVLDRMGKLRTAESMTAEELPDGWPEPPGGSLAMALGFGKESRARDETVTERRRHADDLGVPVEFLDALQGISEDERKTVFEETIAMIKARKSFPASTSANPERRATIVAADAEHAPEFETEMRQRSVVSGRGEMSELSKQYLRAEYTNEAGDLYCQVCHQPMPFKYNGQWYFEAVQFSPKRVKVHYQNALALCPLCSALYAYTRETADSVLLASMREVEVTAETERVTLPAILNGKRVELWFTAKHALDLKTVLDVAGAKR